VIFAYTDTPSAFPTLPSVGGDVVFFVSGSTTGKNGAVRNVAVFGGDTVVSGSLTIGTGSVKITSNDLQFDSFGTRIEKNGNSLKFFDASNTGGLTLSQLNSGGGGTGTNFFFDTAGAGKIYTTASSVAFPMGEAGVDEAADKGVGVVFFVSGSAAGDATSLFGGNVVTSGSIVTKTSTGSPSVSLGVNGTVSGSGTFSVGGDILVQGSIKATDGTTAITLATSTGNVTVAGDLAVNGATSADITTTTATATLFNANATTVTIAGGATTSTTIGNATGGVTLNGTATVTGDLAVNGATSADITTTTTAATIFNTTATSLGIGGQATSVSIGASAGTVTIPGNLTVQGTTTTLDTTNLLVEDPIIYFGSGSTISNQPGGIALASGSSVTHQALVWGRVANDTWGAGRLDVQNGTVTDFSTLTNYLPVRASKFEVGLSSDGAGATRAFVSSSLGTDLILSGTSAVTVGSAIINFQRNDSTYATLNGSAAGNSAFLAAASGRTLTVGTVGQALILSGSSINLNAASAGSFVFQRDGSSAVALSAAVAADQPQLVAGQTNGKFTIGTSGGTTDFLALSGSAVKVNTSAQGFQVQRDSTQVLVISGTNDGAVLAAASVGASPSSLTLTLTGSAVTVGSTSATNFNFAGGTALQLLGDATSATVAAGTSRTTASVFNTVATTVNAFGAATTLNVATAATTTGTYNLITGTAATGQTKTINLGTGGDTGSTTNINLGSTAGGTITSNMSIVPASNTTYDLGTPSLRWRNMYTGDLHLKNERGNWTIIEEREFLSITNNITGKRYKFVLQEIE